jgi:hypothetical protein
MIQPPDPELTMETINTLTELLKQSGCTYQIVELGRRIQPIDNRDFEKIEQGCQPYPFPIQRQAKFAIVYWHETRQPWIWFLTFELDERGLLKATDISQFLHYVLEAMGTRLNQPLSQPQQEKLAGNPYIFTPSEDKMALFHSQVRVMLKQPASPYYEHAQHYFKGELGWDQWHTVGLQGMTDLCARLGQEQNATYILKALPHLPCEPCYALLGALEHTQITDKIAHRLQEMAETEIHRQTPDLFYLSALIRALANAPQSRLNSLVTTVLARPELCHYEVLIALAGRCWPALNHDNHAELFLIRLAQTGQQTLFNQLFADLVMLPELRMIMLPLLHSQTSPALEAALLSLQQSTKGR